MDTNHVSNIKFSYSCKKEDICFSKELSEIGKKITIVNIFIDENNPKYYFQSCDSVLVKEVIRRINDVYSTAAQARFNLVLSARTSFNELLSENSQITGVPIIRSYFLNNAIRAYQSAFDLLLQVTWVRFKIYEDFSIKINGIPVKPAVLNASSMEAILHKCNLDNIKKKLNKIDESAISYIKKLIIFSESDLYQLVIDMANSIKHRRDIKYKEFYHNNGLAVVSENYNSMENIYEGSIDENFQLLVNFHEEFKSLLKDMYKSHFLPLLTQN